MAAEPRRLTDQEQLDHDLVVAVALLRFRRRQRGKRWARRFVARRGWLR